MSRIPCPPPADRTDSTSAVWSLPDPARADLSDSDLSPLSSYGSPVSPRVVFFEEELAYVTGGGQNGEGWLPWPGCLVERLPDPGADPAPRPVDSPPTRR